MTDKQWHLHAPRSEGRVVPAEPLNKASGAEVVEERGLAKGEHGQHNAPRTHSSSTSATPSTLTSSAPRSISTIRTAAAPQAPSYNQRDIKAWQGLYGVTGGFFNYTTKNLVIFSQDKYWRRHPDGVWAAKGFLGELWNEAPPIVDGNTGEGEHHIRLLKRPWNYPGVTATFYHHNNQHLYLASKDKYWVYSFTTNTWIDRGYLADVFPGATPVDGYLPWGDPAGFTSVGLTGAWRQGNTLTFISKNRYWTWDIPASRWTGQGRMSTSPFWAGSQTVGGQRVWDGVGLTGLYFHPEWNVVTAISQNRYYTYNYTQQRWTNSGFLDIAWTNMPGIDAGWQQPITPGASPRDWTISQPMGTTSPSGVGHLGHDVAHRGGHVTTTQQQITAAAQGKIVTILPTCGDYFNVVVIEHILPGLDEPNSPTYSFYGHLDVNPALREGQWVPRGQVLGRPADSHAAGYAWGAHVHFEVKNWWALISPD
ncbi:MAG: peptidoglycan DD-metalloendopeptidase family protein, partial [Actinobacteria bacterium]|nr:peptidoglycan DD-metalloendopeptidase family protein [Actinomycetota bacterium]